MDRKLLQYLVEYLVEEGKAHGCALPPRRPMRLRAAWQALRPRRCGLRSDHL